MKKKLLLSISKNCETLFHQTQKKAEKTLEIKLTKPRETFNFNPPVEVKEDWMIGLIGLEVYNTIFIITEENKNFELYTERLDGEFSYTELKDKAAELLGLSDISPEELNPEKYGPNTIEIYRKLLIEKSETDGYYIILSRYLQSPFRYFESYHRILTGLNEDDIQFKLKQ